METLDTLLPRLADVGLKIGGALLVWFVGRFVIGLALRTAKAALERSTVDATLVRWIGSILSLLLNFILILVVLNVFGVETTSFAALLAAAGLAIGAAWAGLLANFAAGVFLILFKPFKVGDAVTIAEGVTGVVAEIGVFSTTVHTDDNVKTIVGNGSISTHVIENYSDTPHRAVRFEAQLSRADPIRPILADLRLELADVAGVCAEPAPSVEVDAYTEHGPKIALVAFAAHADHDAVRAAVAEMVARRLETGRPKLEALAG